MKILFVCLGNICRSPLAVAIFNHQAKQYGHDTKFFSDSCGTSNYHIGDQPDHRTIRNAQKNGVQINHVGRQLNSKDLEKFDLIFAMDKQNLDTIMRLPNATNNKSKIKLMREYDPNGPGDVPDPYYGGEKDFQEVFDILHRSITHFLKEITAGER